MDRDVVIIGSLKELELRVHKKVLLGLTPGLVSHLLLHFYAMLGPIHLSQNRVVLLVHA